MKNAGNPAATVENRIATVANDLAQSLGQVLGALPGAPHRPQWLARTLGVNAILTSRVLKAAQQQDPFAVAYMMPGPEPLRRLLRAAEKKRIDVDLINQAREVVDRFEQLISIEAGDRSAFDAIISGWLPDARQKVELLAKQAMFRGASQLLGTACDVQHSTVIQYPNAANSEMADQIWIMGMRGLRRTRPGQSVTCDMMHAKTPQLTIAGEPVEDLHNLLEPFCSKPLPRFVVSREEEVIQYTLQGEDVGVQSAIDLVHATYLPQIKPMYRSKDRPRLPITFGLGNSVPAKCQIFDVLLHKDIDARQTPNLKIYRTAGSFMRTAKGHREMDRVDILESIQPLGVGTSKFRTADMPNYLDMLRHVCHQRQWNEDELRGYRCRVDYPMYSAEVVVSFD